MGELPVDGLDARSVRFFHTQEILNSRSLPVRLRDGFARLAAPFL